MEGILHTVSQMNILINDAVGVVIGRLEGVEQWVVDVMLQEPREGGAVDGGGRERVPYFTLCSTKIKQLLFLIMSRNRG